MVRRRLDALSPFERALQLQLQRRAAALPPGLRAGGGGGGGGGRFRSVTIGPAPIPPPVPPEPPVDPLAIYSDEFTGESVNPLWSAYLPELITLETITGGQLRFGAEAGGASGSDWFNALDGILRGPMIEGDALMQVRVLPRNYAGDGPIPLTEYRLVGAAVHDPEMTLLNYCHEVVGCLVPEDGPSYRIEMKNNQDSVSDYITVAWVGDVATDLAIQFVGQICTLASKLATDDEYTVQRIIDRSVDGPPMPVAKWWGIKTYSDQSVADCSGTFDFVRFSTPGFNGGLMLPTA